MNSRDVRSVVVGVDGSPDSLRAVAVAARQAECRGAGLRVVHAFFSTGYSPLVPRGDPRVRSRVTAVLTAAADTARSVSPELKITTHVAEGSDASVLLDEAQHADLLVVGHRGLGALSALFAGALGLHLAGRTPCPLLIVRQKGAAGGPVVVGIGDPHADDDLLEFAFRQADRDRCSLRVVHSWHMPFTASAGATPGYRYGLLETAEAEALAAEVERVGRRYPEIEVVGDLRYGRPAPNLLDESADASMLVVPSRVLGGVRGLIPGSVAMAATQHAPCPVMLVPEHHRATTTPGPRM
jgi:nucleotide-binding universal stress UspA family protein